MDLTRRLRGKQIARVMSNGHVLIIETVDGAEMKIVWVDDNGNIIKGKPLVQSTGVRLYAARGMREIISLAEAGIKLIRGPGAR